LIHLLSEGLGKFQPADVGIQRILKHFIQTQCHDFLAECAGKQAKLHTSSGHSQLLTDIATLWNVNVTWITNAFNWLVENPKVVSKVGLNCFMRLLILSKLPVPGMVEV
jgi:hypothetical protein